MPLTVHLAPFRVTDKLELRATEVFDPTHEERKFDWKEEGSDEGSTMLRVVGVDWEELSVAVTVVVPQSELARVLPPGEIDLDSIAILISVRSSPTRARELITLRTDGAGRWSGEVRIFKASYRRAIDLMPYLVRKTKTTSPDTRVAVHLGAILGQGRPLRIIVDRYEVHVGGSFKIQWEDFRTSDHGWRNSHDDDIFHLDLAATTPILMLNLRYPALRAALHSSAVKGVDAVMRHLANTMIAQTVWLQLFISAVANIQIGDDGSVEEPHAEWQSGVLRMFLPRIYQTLIHDERLKQSVYDLRDGSGALALMSMAGSAVQEHLKTFRLVEQAARAGENVGP